MKFHAIRFTKQDLICMPENEQVFMLIAGNHFNSMNALMKQILFCNRAQGPNEVTQKAAEVSAHIFIKYLAGEVFEGCKYLKQAYPAINRQYETELSDRAKALWRKIEGYFSKPQNSVTKLRNNVGFHTNPKLTKRALAKMDEREPLAFYVTQSSGNALHSGASIASVLIYQIIAGTDDLEEAIGLISHEMMEVVGWLCELIDEVLTLQLERHVPAAFASAMTAEIEVPSKPLAEVRNELFVE